MGWLALLLLIAASAVTVLGLCRAAGRAEHDAEEQAEQDQAARFADQTAVDLAFTTITQHINEEPNP
jgi:hypothetical protein